MWQRTVEPFVASGELTVIGVVQEQHPDRARLYCQWRNIDWPIFVDSLNLLDISAVPIPVALDASGVVRHKSIRPNQFAKRFMNAAYPALSVPASYNRAPKPVLEHLRSAAEAVSTSEAWRGLADACYLLSAGPQPAPGVESQDACDALEAYRKALAIDPRDGRAHFRLGVALRRRYETALRRPGDGQDAVDQWGRALAVDPNQYIWRRRIQQYGPRLDKPYNFYFWVNQARHDIRHGGEEPVHLAVQPGGSELAPPVGRVASGGAASNVNRDPQGRIQRDTQPMVEVEFVVTPGRVKPGQRVRVRTTFRVNQKTRPYWNNEAADLALYLDLPDDVSLGEGLLSYANPGEPETQEVRAVEFELAVAPGVRSGNVDVPAYALYYVCGNKGGKCRYLRQDLTLTINVDPAAPAIR